MTKMILRQSVLVSLMLISIAIVGFSGCQSRIDPNDKSFTIEIPNGWITEYDPEMALVARSPEGGRNDPSFAYLAVGVEIIPIKVSLEKYKELAMDDLRKNFGKFTILEEGTASMSDRIANWLMINYKEQGIDIKAKVIYTVKGRKAYCICIATTPEFYPKYEKVFQQIIDSFRII